MNDSRLRFIGDFPPIVEQYHPWWVRCPECSQLAFMAPNWEDRAGTSTCENCGAVRKVSFGKSHFPKLFDALPLWLKTNFRGNILWALNGEHLNFLEMTIASDLRERPVKLPAGVRMPFTRRMPFNLPKWLISAKNRDDLLAAISKMKKSIPSSLRQ